MRAIWKPTWFSEPANMAQHNSLVFDGEYAVPIEGFAPKRIIDIGACCGAFSLWAFGTYPNAEIEAYEPNPEAVKHLRSNLDRCIPRVCTHTVGVRAIHGQYAMFPGRNNLGETSMMVRGEQHLTPRIDSVDCICAADLLQCDFLKVDTEGCEVEIIASYLDTHAPPRVVAFEFHAAEDFTHLHLDFMGAGYQLARANIHRPDRGVCIYVHDNG